MRRILLFLWLAVLPALFFMNTWQSFKFSMLERRVSELEQSQLDALESNKRAIAWLSVLRSPSRIEALARDSLGLLKVKPQAVLVLKEPRL